MKIYSRLRLISNDDSWFDRLSIKEKNAYIKEHPNSKFAKEMFDDIEDNQSRTEYTRTQVINTIIIGRTVKNFLNQGKRNLTVIRTNMLT